MKPARFHPEAEAELIAAIAFYQGRRDGLGIDLQDEVERTVEQIRRNPEMFPERGAPSLRKCPIQRFPYNVFYLELDAEIWIAAVAHQSRKPGYWSGRSPS